MIDILKHPGRLIWIGGAMLLFGWSVPMLTVIKVLRPNFFLLLGSYALALLGFALGMVGIFVATPRRRR